MRTAGQDKLLVRTCELAESTRSPPAMIQNWPSSSTLAISAVSPKCRSVGSRRTFVPSSLIACRNILGKSCSSLSLSMLTGRIVIHRPTSSRSRGPKPQERPSSFSRCSQCAGYCSRYALAGWIKAKAGQFRARMRAAYAGRSVHPYWMEALDNCVCRSSRFSPRLANVVVGGRPDKIGCRSIKRCGG